MYVIACYRLLLSLVIGRYIIMYVITCYRLLLSLVIVCYHRLLSSVVIACYRLLHNYVCYHLLSFVTNFFTLSVTQLCCYRLLSFVIIACYRLLLSLVIGRYIIMYVITCYRLLLSLILGSFNGLDCYITQLLFNDYRQNIPNMAFLMVEVIEVYFKITYYGILYKHSYTYMANVLYKDRLKLVHHFKLKKQFQNVIGPY
jgi:hypothetical protein